MNIKNRTFFTNWPQTSANPGFAKHNHPSAEMFASLFDSITFKLNWEDKATVTQQGLAMIASDASAQTFVSKIASATGADFIRPHQLPEFSLDATALTDDAYITEYGISIKRTKPSRTGGAGTKYSIKTALGTGGALEFKTGSIQLKGDDAVNAVGTFVFGVVNGTRGFISADSIGGVTSYWEREGESLHPTNYQYNVNIGDYYSTAGRFILKPSTYPTINVDNLTAAGDGKPLYIRAGNGYQTGNGGGTLYLFGGSGIGGGANGNVILCHSGSGLVGSCGVGGAVEYNYMMKIYGNLKVTGTLTVIGGGGNATKMMAMDANGEIVERTFAEAREDILPAGSSGKIIVNSGTAWGAVDVSGNITISATGVATISAGAITNNMVAANADLGLSKIKGTNGDRVLVTNSVSMLLEESTATIDDVQLLSGAAAAGLSASDLLAIKGANGSISFGINGIGFTKGIQEKQVVVSSTEATYDVTSTDRVIIIKIAANGTTLNLPPIDTKTLQVVKIIIQTQQGVAKDVLFDPAGSNAVSYNGSESTLVTISAPNAGTIFELYAAEDGLWTLVKA